MKKLLVALGIIVLLIVIAIIVVPFLIPVERYKQEIAQQVQASTGRTLAIDGPLSVSLFPSIALRAEDVRFSNAPGAAEPQMASLDELHLSVKLFPLLSGRMEIDGFSLVRPVIHLEVDKNGRPNWQFGEAAAEPEPVPEESGDSMASMLRDLRLGEFRVENGLITYLDRQAGTERMEVRDLNMEASLPRFDAPFDATSDFIWKDQKVDITFSTGNLKNLMGGNPEKIAATVESELVDLSLDGTAQTGDAVAVDGTVRLETPSVRKLAAWLAEPLDMPGEGLGPLSIAGQLALREDSYAFSGIELALDDLRATGALSLKTGGARPLVRGELVTDRLDLNPYLPPIPEEEPEWEGWSTEPIDTSGMKAADMELAFRTKALVVRKIQIGESSLDLSLKNGVLNVKLNQMALYDGSGSGSFTLDGSGRLPVIAAKFNLDGVASEPLLKDAAEFERLSGALNTSFSLKGQGQSQRDIVGALNGDGSFTFRDGTLKGVDLAEIAGIIEQISNGVQAGGADMLKNLTSGNLLGSLGAVASMFGGKGDVNKSTKFTSLAATWTAANGVITNKDLELVGPLVNERALLRMNGEGQIALASTELDYRSQIRSFAQSAEGGIGGTVQLTGTVLEPEACVQLGSLCIGNKTKPEELVKDKLQRAITGGGDKDGEGKASPLDKLKGLLPKKN